MLYSILQCYTMFSVWYAIGWYMMIYDIIWWYFMIFQAIGPDWIIDHVSSCFHILPGNSRKHPHSVLHGSDDVDGSNGRWQSVARKVLSHSNHQEPFRSLCPCSAISSLLAIRVDMASTKSTRAVHWGFFRSIEAEVYWKPYFEGLPVQSMHVAYGPVEACRDVWRLQIWCPPTHHLRGWSVCHGSPGLARCLLSHSVDFCRQDCSWGERCLELLVVCERSWFGDEPFQQHSCWLWSCWWFTWKCVLRGQWAGWVGSWRRGNWALQELAGQIWNDMDRYDMIWYDMIRYGQISSDIIRYHHIISYHIISHYITSYHTTSYQIISHRITQFTTCWWMRDDAGWFFYYIILYHILLYLNISYYNILLYLIISYYISFLPSIFQYIIIYYNIL